jgi:hypothetical protein
MIHTDTARSYATDRQARMVTAADRYRDRSDTRDQAVRSLRCRTWSRPWRRTAIA